jgi:hypothetical protein
MSIQYVVILILKKIILKFRLVKQYSYKQSELFLDP